MADLWDDLLSCLELRDVSDAAAREASALVFQGDNLHLSYHRLFGGQLLAQFAGAASLTAPGKAVKSLHALFPREGLSDEPVRYEVTRHHEGGTFATLAIVARQSKGVIATASGSSVTGAMVCRSRPSSAACIDTEADAQVELGLIPWETRSADSLDSPEAGHPEFSLWMRTPAVGEEHTAALAAYATDLTLIGTALRPVDGVSQADAGKAFTSAVTSHTVWFHRPFRTDEWLLLRQHSPLLAHGRCFGRGDILTADGALVASYAQEALLRFR